MYKHRLRKKIFEKGQWRTKIVHTDGELGSGRFDKNGREIFEGDKVKVDGEGGHHVVDSSDFWIKELDEYCTDSIEVVGHAED